MGLAGLALVCLGILKPRGRVHGGMFEGMFICTTILLSSGVLAGIRRATGLTLKLNRPDTSHNLTWYQTRLTQLNERAEQRVQSLVARYAADIPDANVRRVWEDQLRDDVAQKVKRIEHRIQHLQMGCKKWSWGVAVYLNMGEWLVDCLVRWMRNSRLFVVDPLLDHRDELDHRDDWLKEPLIAQPPGPQMPLPSAPPLLDPGKLPEASTSQTEPPPYTLEDKSSI
ncbi:hypothetical protein EV183_002990 [Coemansia sp. RSA 2336]|nr:hypothetical protein EV183_002990 [Coemansia sp. RSA 2336]